MGIYEDILQLEMKVNELKTDYDQYFVGVQKIPPFKLHENVKKLIRRYSGHPISNTGIAFKYNSIVARYTTYNSLWERHLRELDEGKLVRGHRIKPPPEMREDHESPAERIYKEYLAAKATLKEKTDNIKVHLIADLIEKQTAKIKKKYKCSAVDYKVVIEGGEAKIKAVPKK